MQEDLKQAHRLAEMYREQCITLETELAQNREEGDVGREIFKVPCSYVCLDIVLILVSNCLRDYDNSSNLHMCRNARTKWPSVFS